MRTEKHTTGKAGTSRNKIVRPDNNYEKCSIIVHCMPSSVTNLNCALTLFCPIGLSDNLLKELKCNHTVFKCCIVSNNLFMLLFHQITRHENHFYFNSLRVFVTLCCLSAVRGEKNTKILFVVVPQVVMLSTVLKRCDGVLCQPNSYLTRFCNFML